MVGTNAWALATHDLCPIERPDSWLLLIEILTFNMYQIIWLDLHLIGLYLVPYVGILFASKAWLLEWNNCFGSWQILNVAGRCSCPLHISEILFVLFLSKLFHQKLILCCVKFWQKDILHLVIKFQFSVWLMPKVGRVDALLETWIWYLPHSGSKPLD